MPISTANDFHTEFTELKQRFMMMEAELELTIRDPQHGIEGFVVVWNTKICEGGPFDRNGVGIGKGGTRILPDLKLSDIKRLARAMAEKNAAAGLPLGGAKSGLVADCNAEDYEEKCRRFYKRVQDSGILAEDGGMFGGFGYDVGCKPPLNAKWACEELKTYNSFTGKAVEDGGTDYDRQGIAGLGVATAAKNLIEHRKQDIENIRFAVQGLGAMGAAVAQYFTAYGGKLHVLSDPKYNGTWVFENNASQDLIDALFQQNQETAQSLLSKEGTHISKDPQDALYEDVDVIFPCALEDTLTRENAHKVKAPFICEGANNPTTDDAHEILFANGQIVIPDIIANPGGIIAAYVELSLDITPEENAKTRGKVNAAKDETIRRISANTIELLNMLDRLNVRPDLIGDYMAYRNIFYGIPASTHEETGETNAA